MRHLSLLIGLTAVLAISSTSWAQSYGDGAAAALAQQHAAVNDLVQLNLSGRTQAVLNAVVAEANQALADKGYAQEAQQYQAEWNQYYSGTFSQFQFMDLGDHQPLNAWLADYYKKLEYRLGDPILDLLHLDDINILNYAIPVVFQPKGDRRNGDHWDQAEYGKHFVPFSEVVVYWSSYVGCRVATEKYIKFKKYCGIAAITLKNLTGSTIAPRLSVFVYDKATNTKQNEQFVVDYNTFDAQAQQQLSQIPQE